MKLEDIIECAFPNADIAFRIFLGLMVTNWAAAPFISTAEIFYNRLRTTMQQGGLDALSLICIDDT